MIIKERKAGRYAEMLNVIANTCLMFNSREEMGKHIGFTLETNNASSMSYFRRKSTFMELSSEFDDSYRGSIQLEELLDRYEKVSSQFSGSFKRTYMCELNMGKKVDEKKLDRVMRIMDFVCRDEEGEKSEQIDFLQSKKQETLKSIKAEGILSCSIFILLLTGLIPSYSSKKGSSFKIKEDVKSLMIFLRRYYTEFYRENDENESPIVERFETIVRNTKGNRLCRIDMIMFVVEFISNCIGNDTSQNLYELTQQMEIVYPKLGGYWSESEINGTKFYKFEEISNGFYMYEYRTFFEGNKRRIEFVKYEVIFYRIVSGEVNMFVSHPSFYRKLVHKENTGLLREWNEVEFVEDKSGEIIMLDMSSVIRFNDALVPPRMYRIQDQERYEKFFTSSKIPVRNIFPKEDYELTNNIYAITPEYLYVRLTDRDLRQMNIAQSDEIKLLKVPKSLDPALYLQTINDIWGICNFENGETFFVVPNCKIAYQINLESDRERLGIEIVEMVQE